MDLLRISLIIIGLLLIVAIILWERRRMRRAEELAQQESLDDWDGLDEPFSAPERGGELDDDLLSGVSMSASRDSVVDQLDELVAETLADTREALIDPESAETAAVPQERLLVLHIMANNGDRFAGGALRQALEDEGLKHGDMGIFHYQPQRLPQALFSVANSVEPGIFDLEQMDTLQTPGVALFMRLPGPWDGASACQQMVNIATRMAGELGGRVCDERRSTISAEQLATLCAECAVYPAES